MALVAAACGGGPAIESPVPSIPDNPTATSVGSAGSGDGSASALITADGVEYAVDTRLGGSCDTEGEGAPHFTDLMVFGYEVESGERVELVFDRRPPENTPSGQEEFYGRLSIGGDSGGPSWRTLSLDPWLWLADERSTVTGSATMETPDGSESVEVTFEVTCP